MWFRSVLDRVLAAASQSRYRRKGCPSRHPQRAGSLRPLLEVLEDRSLLSTYMVNSLTDAGVGSGLAGDLRYCVANATSGDDTITFGVTGAIELKSALPALNTSEAIQGPGADLLTVERDLASSYSFGIFAVGSTATVHIDGLTLANGVAGDGGAINNAGVLFVSKCTLTGNTSYDRGGAIYSAGPLTISNCTLARNLVEAGPGGDGYGGAIFIAGGTLSMSSSTLSTNLARGGDGIDSSGDGPYGPNPGWPAGNALAGALCVVEGATAVIDHCTIADNKVLGGTFYFSSGGGYIAGEANGGGIFNAGSLRMYDTILADNSFFSVQGTGASDLYGTFTSLGHNLFGSLTGASGFGANDLLNIDPKLGQLQDNGGPTQTMALLVGSPAVNSGDNAGNSEFDQRGSGFPRIVDGMIDIGAFEVQAVVPPTIIMSDASRLEGNAGATAAVFTVQLTSASSSTVTVHYSTADGTAAAGSDYQGASGTLTIPAGQTSGTITVLVNGDRLAEPNEIFSVNLSSPTNATVADGQGVGTIVDDEPRISIGDVSKSEGRKGKSTSFTFTITLSAAYDQPITVSYRTVDGTAKTSNSDYVAKSGTITFAPGETTKTITITVKGDSKKEADETFYLDLFGNSNNSLITKSRGIGTILNDD